MSGPAKQTEQTQSQVGVTCAKCEHVNARGQNVCEACGAHLHVVCHNCGNRNARSRTRCEECGHKLHRSWAKRSLRALLGKDKTGLQVLLLIVAILFGILAIVLLSTCGQVKPLDGF